VKVKTKVLFVAGICFIFLIGVLQVTYGQQLEIPSWIKNNAKWWSKGQINDSDFIKGLQYLVQNGIMKIPSSSTNVEQSNTIPLWIRNNAGWWANGTISDNDFVLGIQYLIQAGIINVKQNQNSAPTGPDISKCNQLKSPAEIETCQEEIELDYKLKNSMSMATPYTFGPITFYYVSNHIDHTQEGKTILTIHFVVENTGNSEVTMSCPKQDMCNYALSGGQKEIPYATNTLVYGSLTLLPNVPKFLDWTFYEGLDYDSAKNYSFLIKEPWGSGTIPLTLH
jgi:hypothetical protein